MAIFFTFPPTLNHLHPLQVENCNSNSRRVVDEDDNGKFRPERVNGFHVSLSRVVTVVTRENVVNHITDCKVVIRASILFICFVYMTKLQSVATDLNLSERFWICRQIFECVARYCILFPDSNLFRQHRKIPNINVFEIVQNHRHGVFRNWYASGEPL